MYTENKKWGTNSMPDASVSASSWGYLLRGGSRLSDKRECVALYFRWFSSSTINSLTT